VDRALRDHLGMHRTTGGHCGSRQTAAQPHAAPPVCMALADAQTSPLGNAESDPDYVAAVTTKYTEWLYHATSGIIYLEVIKWLFSYRPVYQA